ncbi:hypothetical protein [Desulfolucanica intricata]|uniref:hypothetical protein n=1 Tax=Desulfolucanica intricata TaxID=1285191 RepID=UPI000836E97C|nr:hypothetical protein [Desulfolucanica intricata]
MQNKEQQKLNSEQFLAYLYIAQQHSFFGDLVMEKLLNKLKISEDDLIKLFKECIEQGWLSVNNFNAGHFLRPGRITNFPVIISSRGINYLKENNLVDYYSLDLRDVDNDV